MMLQQEMTQQPVMQQLTSQLQLQQELTNQPQVQLNHLHQAVLPHHQEVPPHHQEVLPQQVLLQLTLLLAMKLDPEVVSCFYFFLRNSICLEYSVWRCMENKILHIQSF